MVGNQTGWRRRCAASRRRLGRPGRLRGEWQSVGTPTTLKQRYPVVHCELATDWSSLQGRGSWYLGPSVEAAPEQPLSSPPHYHE